jgi:hypothetical protein
MPATTASTGKGRRSATRRRQGSKVLMLVYNLRDEEIHAPGGVDGSAYLVGGVGVTFQRACRHRPIRAGVGLRLGPYRFLGTRAGRP